MAKIKAGSIRAGEAVAGRVKAGQTTLNSGTIYETPVYQRQYAQVDLSTGTMISVGDTDAVVGGPEAYVGRTIDKYIYVQAQDWTSPVTYQKTQ